jgi:uncharacterized protein YdeI (YjbR/CyaY-like superfamily)
VPALTLPSRPKPPLPKPKFFKTAADFRAWLEQHGETKTELWMGYWKKTSGKGGLVYQEALDEALCLGWIDGIIKSVDGECYMQRWTPRTKTSHWSLVNLRKFTALEAAGRVHPRGRAAFDRKTPERIGRASHESAPKEFTREHRERLMKNPKAFTHWKAQPDGYRRTVKHWIYSAKQEATRERRFQLFIKHSEKGTRLPQFISPPGKK